MKYTEEKIIEIILQKVPTFREVWEAHLEFWDGETPGLIVDFAELARYITQIMEANKPINLHDIFTLLEDILQNGTETLQNAVKTGFLEALLSPITKDTTYLPLLLKLLGEKSKMFCREWLKFNQCEILGF